MPFAFVFPGQGSQSIGMLARRAAAEPQAPEAFAEASQVLGYDLWKLCQQGPEDQLGSTERTQPAMLTAGVAPWRVWRQHGGPTPAGQGAMAAIAVERAIEVLKSKGAKRAIKLPVSASLAQALAACRSHS